MASVLFVCLGNICRSPLAEGIFSHLVTEAGLQTELTCDSAVNGAWHQGEPPDPRAIAIARKHGLDLSTQRARAIKRSDFTRFDLILCMDRHNLRELKRIQPHDKSATIDLFLHRAHGVNAEVNDPYYGGMQGFEQVFSEIMVASQALLEKLKAGS